MGFGLIDDIHSGCLGWLKPHQGLGERGPECHRNEASQLILVIDSHAVLINNNLLAFPKAARCEPDRRRRPAPGSCPRYFEIALLVCVLSERGTNPVGFRTPDRNRQNFDADAPLVHYELWRDPVSFPLDQLGSSQDAVADSKPVTLVVRGEDS